MTDVTRLADLTDQQFAALPKDTIVLVPLGSIEPHGHLPLGTDSYIAEQVLERVAARVSGTCLAPVLPLGYLFKYAAHTGALGVDADVVERSLVGICGGFAAAGLRRVFVMSGHDENREPALLALHESSRRFGTISVYCDWLDLAWSLAKATSTSKREGHGSEIQTSVFKFLRPEFPIDVPRSGNDAAPPLQMGEDDLFAESEAGTWVRPAGSESSRTGDPSAATAEKGGLIVERIVSRSVTILRSLGQVDGVHA